MKFEKDILLIDFEYTNADPSLAEPTQLAAILLDKETLEEKDSFVSLIKAEFKHPQQEAIEVSGIDQARVASAPLPAEVISAFVAKFGYDVMLASWVEHGDRRMLHKMLREAGLDPMRYDYHFLDLWPVAYVHLLKQGYEGGMHSEDMFAAYGLPVREKHDALEDCRLEAEVLRKVMGYA